MNIEGYLITTLSKCRFRRTSWKVGADVVVVAVVLVVRVIVAQISEFSSTHRVSSSHRG